MNKCLFCQIASGEKPVFKIYEDDQYLAFLDIFPFGEGHIQVIPKNHYRYVWDIPNAGELFSVVQKIVNHIRDAEKVETCYSLIIGELIPHAHIQILPATTKTKKDFPAALAPLRQTKIDNKKAQQLVDKLSLTK